MLSGQRGVLSAFWREMPIGCKPQCVSSRNDTPHILSPCLEACLYLVIEGHWWSCAVSMDTRCY
jgi:hypothetical protein